MRGGPQGAQPHLGNGREPGEGKNVQSLKQILTMGDAKQAASTPLAANVPSEENADLYKVQSCPPPPLPPVDSSIFEEATT
jgi:hypothetical protein